MPVTALSATEPAPAALNGGSPAAADNEQRFLKLLVTQLNNQDPLNPMENAQLTSQLAQMSTVSGIEKMNATLQALLGQGSSAQLLQAAGMVGRAVLATGNELLAGDGPTGFGVELPASAESVQAVITDGTGQAVRTIDLGALPSGRHAQTWDGKDAAGQAVPAGVYRVQITAANGGHPVPATTLVYDQVLSVTQDASGCTLDLSTGRSIALADVRMLR